MNNTINVTVKTGYDYYYRKSGQYDIDVDGHELTVDQRCMDRLHDLCKGEWSAEFEDGEIILYGSFKRSQPPSVCSVCGKRISFMRSFCDPCLEKMIARTR